MKFGESQVAFTGAKAAAAESRRELFENLLKSSYKQAYQLAFRLTGDSSDAEDLVQEAFLRAYRFFYRYKTDMPFTNWLFRIMTNAFIDHTRRRSKTKETSLDTPHSEQGATRELSDESFVPDKLLIHEEFDMEVQEALKKMTPDFRVAVLLSDLEGLSYEEIAQVMGTSIGTVRSRIHRGRKQLRNYLLKSNPEKYGQLV
ncbi:MAG TPA: sigma-70 family RNA polymerase sigma factor [Fimbriimonadales bacterium]|nr:sigma-70 family RNA polymerase sigma factor [Fimbriimonadales bacterium]